MVRSGSYIGSSVKVPLFCDILAFCASHLPALIVSGVRVETLVEYMKQGAGIVK
jgi:hypothetical protein